MPIVAIAFREELAQERLERYFDSFQPAGGCVKCPQCRLSFTVIFVNRADRKNADYPDRLAAVIGEDCIHGLHRDEYVLNIGTGVKN